MGARALCPLPQFVELVGRLLLGLGDPAPDRACSHGSSENMRSHIYPQDRGSDRAVTIADEPEGREVEGMVYLPANRWLAWPTSRARRSAPGLAIHQRILAFATGLSMRPTVSGQLLSERARSINTMPAPKAIRGARLGDGHLDFPFKSIREFLNSPAAPTRGSRGGSIGSLQLHHGLPQRSGRPGSYQEPWIHVLSRAAAGKQLPNGRQVRAKAHQPEACASRSVDVMSIIATIAFTGVYCSGRAECAVACRTNRAGGGSDGL